MIRKIGILFLLVPAFVRSMEYIAVDTALVESARAEVTALINKDIECPVCKIICHGVGQLTVHIKDMHPQVKDKYLCSCCGERFLRNCMLRRHIQVQHVAIRPFSCKHAHCDYTANRLDVMKNHQAVVHGIGLQEVRCLEPGCGLLFKRVCQLNQHVDLVHNKVRPYQCLTCGDEFGTRGNLNAHCERKRHFSYDS